MLDVFNAEKKDQWHLTKIRCLNEDEIVLNSVTKVFGTNFD